MILWCVEGKVSHFEENGSILVPNTKKYSGRSAMAVHNFIWKEAIDYELFRQFQSEHMALNHNNDHEIAIDEEVDMNEQSEMAAIREAIADAISLS